MVALIVSGYFLCVCITMAILAYTHGKDSFAGDEFDGEDIIPLGMVAVFWPITLFFVVLYNIGKPFFNKGKKS